MICKKETVKEKDKKSSSIRNGLKKMMISSLAVFLSVSLFNPHVNAEKWENATPEMEFRVKGIITVNGKKFKDLNGNKKLDPYENWQLKDEDRVKDRIAAHS
jgi:beta-glucosidase